MGGVIERYSDFAVSYRRLLLAFFIVVTGIAIAALPSIKVHTSIRDFLSADAGALRDYDAFIESFGGNATIMVTIESDRSLDPAALLILSEIEAELAAKVHVYEMVGAGDIRVGEGGATLLSQVAEAAQSSSALDDKIATHPELVGAHVSPDLKTVALTITPWSVPASRVAAPPPDASVVFDCADSWCEADYLGDLVAEVETTAAAHQAPGLRISVIGSSVMNEYLEQETTRTMGSLFLGALAVITIVLWFLFRRVVAVAVCLLVVVMAIVWGLGALAIARVPLSAVFQLYPAFLLVVGVSFTIHLLAAFFSVAEAAGPAAAMRRALSGTAKSIFAAGLTTVFGMLCFAVASVPPVAHLGIFSGLGVAFALLITLLFVPALTCSLPASWLRRDKEVPAPYRIVACLHRASDWAVRKPGLALTLVLAALFLFSLGVPMMQIKHDPLRWLAADHPFRANVERLNVEGINGFVIEALADSGETDGALDPGFVAKVAAFGDAIRGLRGEGFTIMNVQSMPLLAADGQAAPDGVSLDNDDPTTARAINRFVDAERRIARVEAKIPWTNYLETEAFERTVAARGDAIFGPGTVIVTGKPIIVAKMADALISSMVGGYLLAAVFITLILILWLRRWRLIVVALCVNFLPLVAVVGLVGWMSIPVDLYLLLVGTIVVSIAVDDTFHLLVSFEGKYQAHGRHVGAAIRAQLGEVGGGVVFTSLIIILGFATFATSSMSNLANFGLVVAFGAAVALVCDIIVGPALLAVLMRPAAVSATSSL